VGLTAAITWLVKKQRLANPRHGFYLILCHKDQMNIFLDFPRPILEIDDGIFRPAI
jgi:hypothetical protein